jgi:hypothetical protein
MRSVAVLACLVLSCGIGLCQEESDYHPPVETNGQPLISTVHWESMRSILPKAFAQLRPGTEGSGRKALRSIKPQMKMTEAAVDATAKRIDEVLKETGPYAAYDLLGIKALPREERLYRLAYLTYGSAAPALWEATLYHTEEGWKVVEIAVGTDGIFNKAGDYR